MIETTAANPSFATTNDSGSERNAGKLTDRLAADIDFDLELDGSVDIPEKATTSLDEADFDDSGDDEPPEKPEPKKAKPEPAAPPPSKPEPEKAEAKAKLPLPPDRGTEEEPYGINDLPEDRYVKVKVDGEERVLTMRELADGAIMKRTFDTSMSKVNEVMRETQEIAQRHIAERKQIREDLQSFLGSEERIFKTLLERDPDLMLRLGALIGEQYGAWAKDPSLRQRHEYERQQREIAAERKRTEDERKSWEQERQQREASERARQTWEPHWKAALKEAGFPKLTPEFQDTVKALVGQAQRRDGGKLTPEAFKACVKRAAKLVEAETVADRPPPAQERPAARETAPRKTNGRSDDKRWEGMSHAARMRDDNWLLRK